MKNGFYKGHGLGNDYIVMDPAELEFELTPDNIRYICDRNRGIGGDGILTLEPGNGADYGLRILNPDGSEAEKSGNGLRIFARFLHATRRTRKRNFTVDTIGGRVEIQVHPDHHGDASLATVEMGQAAFNPGALPCTLPGGELIGRPISAGGRELKFTGVSVGNPHCVLFKPEHEAWTRDDLLELGPALENHKLFPNRINVQLAVPTGPKEIFILIWERGAGETQASGSSSCAAACAAVRLGLVTSPVTVNAPGGALYVAIDAGYHLTMKGPVSEVGQGVLSPAFVRELQDENKVSAGR